MTVADETTPDAGSSEQHVLVRPFIITKGRTRASRSDIRLETLIERVADDGPGTHGPGTHGGHSVAEGAVDQRTAGRPAAPEEAAILLVIAAGPTSVAEIGAHTGLPLGVVAVLIGDLLDSGAVRLHHTDPVDIDVSSLARMIERVRAL